jgi:uncharacterized membrane protein
MQPIPRRSRTDAAVQAQRGAVAIIVAAVLTILGALLVSLQMGYDYLQEQRLQKAADLAALSAVQVLGATTCDPKVTATAVAVATLNGKDISVGQVECGRWAGAPAPVFEAGTTGTQLKPLNAVKIAVAASTVSFLPNLFGAGQSAPASTLSATSTAVVGPPVATFSVGARLLSLQPDGLVANVLKPVGLTPQQLDILSSDGLANFMVTPGGLLQALGLPPTILAGIGTSDQLAKLDQLTLGDLLDAYGMLLDRATPVDANIGLLDSAFAAIKATDLNLPIQLFGQDGVIANITAEGENPGGFVEPSALTSALNTQIGLGDLIGSSVLAANGLNFIDLDATLVPGVASLKAQVVSPPNIVTGPVGASASNAQIQLLLNTDPIPVPLVSSLVGVELPVVVQIGTSTGHLDGISFESQPQSASFHTKVATARLCIGNLLAQGQCINDTQPEYANFLNLLSGVVGVGIRANIPLVASGTDDSKSIDVGNTELFGAAAVPPPITWNQVDAKISGLLGFLGVLLDPVVSGAGNALVLLLNNLLTPLLQTVGHLLGIDLNQTDIHLYSVTRGAPYLVQ